MVAVVVSTATSVALAEVRRLAVTIVVTASRPSTSPPRLSKPVYSLLHTVTNSRVVSQACLQLSLADRYTNTVHRASPLEAWETADLIPLFEKGKHGVTDNCRGIILLNEACSLTQES